MAARVPDTVRLQILALAASGHSQRQICRRLEVSKSTVQRTLSAAEPRPAAEPAPVEPALAPAPENAREMFGEVIDRAAELADEALTLGDLGAAQRATRDLRDAANALRRLDTIEVAPGIEMTESEIYATMAGIYQRTRDLVAEHETEHGPAICPGCGARLTLPALGNDLPALPEARGEQPARDSPAEPHARKAYSQSMHVAAAAKDDGNTRAAAKAVRDALGAASTVARIERDAAKHVTEQTYRFAEAETAKHLDRLRAQAEHLSTVPLMCGPCGARARMAAVAGAVSPPG